MRKSSLALAAVLLLVAGVLCAQKYDNPPRAAMPQKLVPAGLKHMGRAAPRHTPVAAPRHGGNSLDTFYGSTDVPKPIRDLQVSTSTLTIPDAVTIENLNVHVVITHSWMRDLQVSLTGPNDTFSIVLFDTLPWDNAVNMDGWFNDAAGRSVFDADTPLVGTWRPYDSLSVYNGRSAQGIWTLRVWDQFRGDTGHVDAWGIDVNPTVAMQGTVTNSLTRSPVSGAKVEVLGTDFSSLTDAAGRYAFLQFPSDTHTVQFTKPLYKVSLDSTLWQEWDTLAIPGFSVPPGDSVHLDTAMSTVQGFFEFLSSAAPVPIPDYDTTNGVRDTTMSLNVRNSVAIGDLDVVVNITHSYDSDLSLWLISPGGDTILLSDRAGGNSRNYINCRFDDQADTAIAQGAGPFSGSFRPVHHLDDTLIVGSFSRGNWSLMVADSGLGDSGTINGFALEIRQQQTAAVDPRNRNPLPQAFAFEGNYPNPFNSQTEFRFDLPLRGRVELVLYNMLGQRVANVVTGTFDAGTHLARYDAAALASGVYFARLTYNGTQSQSRKVLLLK